MRKFLILFFPLSSTLHHSLESHTGFLFSHHLLSWVFITKKKEATEESFVSFFFYLRRFYHSSQVSKKLTRDAGYGNDNEGIRFLWSWNKDSIRSEISKAYIPYPCRTNLSNHVISFLILWKTKNVDHFPHTYLILCFHLHWILDEEIELRFFVQDKRDPTWAGLLYSLFFTLRKVSWDKELLHEWSRTYRAQ